LHDFLLRELFEIWPAALGLVGNVAAENEQALARDAVVERLIKRIDELINDRLRRRLGLPRANFRRIPKTFLAPMRTHL
jgi:hypothetical protein